MYVTEPKAPKTSLPGQPVQATKPESEDTRSIGVDLPSINLDPVSKSSESILSKKQHTKPSSDIPAANGQQNALPKVK